MRVSVEMSGREKVRIVIYKLFIGALKKMPTL